MDKKNLENHYNAYRDDLLNETMPFWFPRSVDREYGGFVNSLGRDGTIMQKDKYVWFQGRSVWTLSQLYNSVEKNGQWRDDAKIGMEFIDKYCFDENQRAYYSLTQDGRPVQKNDDIYSDIYLILGKAAYSLAFDDQTAGEQALSLFQNIVKEIKETPYTSEGSPRTHAAPMVLIVTAQEIRKIHPIPWLTKIIDDAIRDVERYLMKPEFSCVLEMTGPDGELIDTFAGRTICPGHSFETCWFILEEARLRNNDPRLIRIATTILDWTFPLAWDGQYGGLFQSRDCRGLLSPEYHDDMKHWWTHTEAIIATLMAWMLTSEPRYAQWYQQLHQWCHSHFHAPLYGEWFAYLHRDGTVSTELKGNAWKGPFHLPRMQWYCQQRIREHLAK